MTLTLTPICSGKELDANEILSKMEKLEVTICVTCGWTNSVFFQGLFGSFGYARMSLYDRYFPKKYIFLDLLLNIDQSYEENKLTWAQL